MMIRLDSLHQRRAVAVQWLRAVLILALALALLHTKSFSWIYPEHRQIAVRGILRLDPQHQATLQSLWSSARTRHDARLSRALVDSVESGTVSVLDYPAWPAIAGDHSCSADDMLNTILYSSWILDVATVTAKLENDLSAAGLRQHDRINALRDSDLRLQRADPAYATRAGANNVHFLLARPYAETDERSYVETCLGNGCEPNALGTWAWYHLRALEKAHQLSRSELPEDKRSALARAILADEAYGLHFLQDSFASGHVAGTRGSAAERKGTHDYYNEHGLETRTWSGKTVVLKGDAWMRREEAERAAIAVQTSLEQVLDAVRASGVFAAMELPGPGSAVPDTMNTCKLDAMPGEDLPPHLAPLLTQVINQTPVPGLAEGEGELPRFRAEVGPFIGVVPAVRAGMVSGGFSRGQTTNGFTGGLELAVRLGLGLDGVMNESGDGLVFVDLGFKLDAAASTSLAESEEIQRFGAIFSSIPSRAALATRLRLPFWLLPLDLLLAAPVLLPTSPETFASMAVMAGNGGLIPWQAGIATSVGRFQFILGREVGASFYGYAGGGDRLLLLVGDPAEETAVLATFRSFYLEFPVLEYMPFRSYSADQSSSLVIQLFGGVDIPASTSEIFPEGGAAPVTQSVWQMGLRAAFRWRHYW